MKPRNGKSAFCLEHKLSKVVKQKTKNYRQLLNVDVGRERESKRTDKKAREKWREIESKATQGFRVY